MSDQHLITWIASFPRSGNTWLRALITAYANGGEVDINNIMQTGDKDPMYYGGIINAPINTWSMSEQAMLKPAAMMRMLEHAGNNLLLKTHDCNGEIAGVEQIPPYLSRAAIYMVRDPRDVALSFMNHYNMPNMDATLDNMLSDETLTRFPDKGLFVPQRSWQMHAASWLRKTPYPVHILRYEDLLAQPFKEFSKVVRILQMDFDAKLLKKSIEACEFSRLQKAEQKSGFTEGVGQAFFHKGTANRWETELSQTHQARIVKACSVQMKALDYL
jgi:hypothetical protein